MEAYKKNLKVSGSTLIFVAVCELIVSIIEIINPSSARYASLTSTISNYKEFETAVIAISIVISVIVFVLLLLIGLKAIVVSKGGRYSGGLTVLAWVMFVLYILSIIYSIVDMVTNGTGFFESHIIISICVAMCLFALNFAQKKYLNSKVR